MSHQRRVWVVWSVGLAAYLVGVVHRARRLVVAGALTMAAGRARCCRHGRGGRGAGATAWCARAGAASPREVLDGLRSSWREPGTRLGLWTHTGTQFSGTVFALQEGVPYLVAGLGFSAAETSALLTLLVAVGIVAGPLFGELTARHPLRRSWLVLAVIAATLLGLVGREGYPPEAFRVAWTVQ